MLCLSVLLMEVILWNELWVLIVSLVADRLFNQFTLALYHSQISCFLILR